MKTSISDMWIWLSVVVSIGIGTLFYFFPVVSQNVAMVVGLSILFSMCIPLIINRRYYFSEHPHKSENTGIDDMNA